MAPAIGIDLGTTNSCVAVCRQGRVEIIANDIGKRTTPSYVAFTEKGRLVGNSAKRQAAMIPKNAFFDTKRLIGRRSDDSKVLEDMKYWPFGVVDIEGKPILQAEVKKELMAFTPEEISSVIIGKMKETAEAFLGTEVKDAVISVPANFNDSQRQATKDAGKIAGLNVLRIINEPTAAALAYGLQKDLKGERNVLIYDLGGGKFDVTILTITEGNVFKVNATAGDTSLGGMDFDGLVVEFLAQRFKKSHGKDVNDNPRAMKCLRHAAECAKIDVSSSTTSSIEIDSLFEEIDFSTHLSQKRFNALCLHLFVRTLELLTKALADAKMDKSSIDDIVLVGGSTRIPKVQELLREFFPGKELQLSINPDEAVAYGAAVQAAILSGDPSYKEVLLIDVTPLSLSLENWMKVPLPNFIQRNTQVPFKRNLVTLFEHQTSVTISLFEGENSSVKGNKLLGTLVVHDIPKYTDRRVGVILQFDTDCILKVTAIKRYNGDPVKATILKTSNLTEEDINKIRKKTKQWKAEEKCELERNRRRNSLESYIYEVKAHNLSNSGSNEGGVLNVDICEEALQWLEAHPLAAKEEYEEKKRALVLLMSAPIITHL